MKTVIDFFKNKWVIQLLGILALSLLIWFVGPLIAIGKHVPLASETTRFITILILLLLWGLNNLRIQIKNNRANAQMVTDLTQQQDTPESEVSKEADAEISTIAKNFDEALLTLKKGAKNSHGQHYLYDLPWYIIIGPPGSGKTTALINSGLEFPLADKFGKGAIRGVSGTRNCDWWFTDQAVLLDTAGRYVTQDSHEAVDKAAWFGFLDLLKKYRPRRPVNGVLITMSLSDLLKQTEQERSQHAQAIRQRIEELHSHFGIRFPIYMLFTKTDLIAGFNDFFANLSKEERAQVWGVTFPEEDPNHPVDIVARVGKDFDDLLNRLNSYLPKRLQEERDLQRRHLIFGFPQRMALLQENLLSFLQECYGINRYQSAPCLRGVYFTSGTQEGTPIDRLMGILANNFKLDRFSMPLFSGKGKSYFITRLLKEVVFEEALLVGTNRQLERMQTLLRRGVYISAALILLVMTGLWLTSYNKNQNTLDELGQHIQHYDSVATANPHWQSDFSDMLKRLNAMQAVQVYSDDAPWLMTFGLYQGDKLQPVIEETYHDLLQKQFLPLIKARLEQRIKDQYGNADMLYQLLEVYLMLGDTKRLKPELLRPWVAVDWEKTYATDTDTQLKLLEHLDNLLTLPLDSLPVDERLVAAARQILNRIPIAQQIYMRIKSDNLQTHTQDFKLSNALGANANRVFASKNGELAQQTIPYLFTYDGFYGIFLKQAKEQTEQSLSQNWVLGDTIKTDNMDSHTLEQTIYSYYYQDYIKYWDRLVNNLTIKPAKNAQETTEVLEFASRPDSPVRKLLETLNKETSLTKKPPSPLDEAKGKKAAGILMPSLQDTRTAKLLALAKTGGQNTAAEPPLGSEVEQHFLPLTSLVRGATGGAVPLDNTLKLLEQLYGYMIDLTSTSNAGSVALGKAGASSDVLTKIKMEALHLPEPLKKMIETLGAGSQNLIMGSSKEQLNRLWQSEVLPLYRTALQGRYPFNKGSDKEVTLADFSRFYAQGGVLDQFFNTHLKALVDTSGKNWRMIAQNNQAISVSAAALAQLQYAEKLRQMFFAGAGQTPLVKFNLKPLSLDSNASKFWLNLEGQQSDFTATEPAKNAAFQWPGTDGSRLVSFGFDTLDGRKLHRETEGFWAWFRVLANANIQKTDLDKYIITFDIDGSQARYELSANSVDNPFSLKVFDNIRLPSSL